MSAPIIYLMLSGGVDSSVAALVLKEQGYDVRCVFMQCWSEVQLTKLGLNPSDYACSWDEDAKDAQWVAHKLGLPFEIWDLRDHYYKHVVQYMVDEYKHGSTPNPDVMCNSFVKFGVFAERALSQGADYVATGHYARIVESGKYGCKLIARALDDNKDQSYFLARVKSELINKTLFPIGEFLTKADVRAKAQEAHLITANKPDSQGICFIGDTPLREILLKTLGSHPGKVINKITNQSIGNHNGAFLYTIGQRHGLGLSGGPWFVHSIDIDTNTVYVVHETESQALESRGLMATLPNWYVDTTQLATAPLGAQIRYRQQAQEADLTITSDGFALSFHSPARAVARGQIAAIYDGELLVGSGVIT
jgi:tRNA-uridine 2-sulfurtransferase